MSFAGSDLQAGWWPALHCEVRACASPGKRAERDPQCPAAWPQDAAAPAADALQAMVKFAHHPEVAILDELRAHDTLRISGFRAWRGIRRQTARDIGIITSNMLMPRD